MITVKYVMTDNGFKPGCKQMQTHISKWINLSQYILYRPRCKLKKAPCKRMNTNFLQPKRIP